MGNKYAEFNADPTQTQSILDQAHNGHVGVAHVSTSLISSTCSKHGAHSPYDVAWTITSDASKMVIGNFPKKDTKVIIEIRKISK